MRGGLRRIGPALQAAVILGGCGGASGGASAPAPSPDPAPELPAAPWAGPPLDPAAVPDAYLQEWRAAENRRTCALLAFRDPEPAAEARAAEFGGGWGVAYDTPGQRSAYGVAGTGVRPGRDTYDDWPRHLAWTDGSQAGYGPEGGSGPKQLAYLQVGGEGCLYNVWSLLGVDHLESLLERLRFVESPGG